MGKNHSMSRVERSRREKVTRYSVRKVSFGAASVAVAAFFMFLGNGAVYAAEPNVTATDPALAATPANNQLDENSGTSEATAPKAQADTTTPAPTDTSSTSVESAPASKVQDETPAPTPVAESASVTPAPASSTEEVEEKATPALDKKQLEDYVAEIDAKLASDSYATKTDESVATLKEHLGLAKLALTTAKSQEELTKAYRRLFMTVNSGLRSKPKAQVESPKLDTTEGKATVGKKASNTEKATGTNSIANSGQRDPRNRQALDRNNPFRTGETTTDTDLAANQVYAAPSANASVKDLSDKLQGLQDTVENNSKIQNMKAVGDSKGVPVGGVAEIKEFGGWKAVNQADGQAGTFAIARKTADDVFPLETINTTIDDKVWLREQAFDRTSDYMLFLAKPRNRQTKDSRVLDGSDYKYRGEGSGVSKNIVGFNGIEKTFKTYFKDTDGIVRIKFKTGYTGDDEGHKASYKVEVFAIREGVETRVYETTFDPSQNANDAQKIVKKANDGTSRNSIIRISSTPSSATNSWDTRQGYVGKKEAERRIAEPQNKPNGTPGTFESKDISLGKGSDSYKVRISLANPNVAGGSYQSWDTKYTLPVSGVDFSIAQDTSAIAKDLLQKIYDKLTDSKTNDVVWATPETKRAYEEKLKEAEMKLKESALKTRDYKNFATELIEKYEHLKEKTQIVNSSIDIIEEAKKVKDREIDDNADLSQTEKQAAKDAVAKAATIAKKLIKASENPDEVKNEEQAGIQSISDIVLLGKDSAKAAIDTKKAAKDKEIDDNADLSQTEKQAAKDAVAKAATAAKNAIDAAKDQDGINQAKAAGESELDKVSPLSKDSAKAAIDTKKAAKDKEIDDNADLSQTEKQAAKAQVAAEAKKAIEAIEKATTEADVEAAKEAGKAEIAKVAPETTDYKAKAKAEVEAELAKKLAELENATDLTEAEKAAAKAQVVNKAKEAIEAIQKAATEADVDQAIRNFVYRISAVIREQEEYDLSKLFVNGSVTVKQGESLTDKDVLSKLNLPSGVEIVKVEKPTTSALGTVMAKVTVKLADGSVEEINVPVEVIVSQNHGNEGNGANNGANNTEAKVNKAKLEGAIHQLDELLLKESAKLDAETAKEANVLSADAKKVFANADATQAEVDAMVKRIEDFMAKVAPLTDHANTANDQSAQTPAVVPANNQSAQTTVVAPATTQAAANASQTLSAQANARKAAKELPNTGTADSTVAMVAAAASALLGLGLAGRRRKEDEEA